MMKGLVLASGNTFIYWPETEQSFSCAMIVDRDFNFVGGFLCDEADRKLAAFTKLANVQEISIGLIPDVIKLELFASKLGSASKLFIENFHLNIVDLEDCDGTSSRAESCDERKAYYKAVGCSKIFKSTKKFPMWAFISNHVSVFSIEHFRRTFFKGYEQCPLKDEVMERVATRYSNENFKAPAAYVRALCRS